MTVKELKQELKSRGLKTSGNKAVLKERLAEALAQSESQTSSDPVTTEEVDNVDSTIADFEDYINVSDYNQKSFLQYLYPSILANLSHSNLIYPRTQINLFVS